MPNINAMKNFYNSGQYEEGIRFAAESENRADFDDWDYLYYLNCLYKLEKYAECLEVYEEFHEKYPDSTLLNDKIGWCRYHVDIKPFDFDHGNKEQFISMIDEILSSCSDSEFSPKTWIATVAAEAVFKSKLAVNPDYELGDKYLSMIDPATLSLKERENTTGYGRTVKAPSDREKWYGRKTKALEKLERYDECLEYIEKAFADIPNFHNNEDHWLNYRKAKCFLEQGDADTAEKLINDTLKSFKHWCFYELLFKIAVARNDTEAAMHFGCLCATADREHSLRVTFYENFASFLLDNGKEYEAALLFKLIEEIREEKGWKGIRLPDGFSYPGTVTSLDKKAVIRELEEFWNEEKNKGVEFHEGVISRILSNGNSGFIHDNNGNNYYFSVRDFVKKVHDVREGDKVRYTLVDRLDRKKNEVKPNAVEISFIK